MRPILVNVSEECFERLKVAAGKSHREIECEAASRLEESLGIQRAPVAPTVLLPEARAETTRSQRTVADLAESYARHRRSLQRGG